MLEVVYSLKDLVTFDAWDAPGSGELTVKTANQDPQLDQETHTLWREARQ